MAVEDTIKQIADNTIGILNKGTRTLLELLDPQNKNLFEILLYPKAVESNPTDIGSLASGALDSTITRLYIQNINFPFLGIEYETYNELKGTKGVTYPEDGTITFIENELGIVRNYLNRWLKEIIFPVKEKDATSGILRTNYVFTENQEGAKKNAIIMPLTGLGVPSTGWIKLEGLKYKSMENIEFSQGATDPMLITVTLSCDTVWWKTLV